MKVLRDLGLNINEEYLYLDWQAHQIDRKEQCFIALQGLSSHGLD